MCEFSDILSWDLVLNDEDSVSVLAVFAGNTDFVYMFTAARELLLTAPTSIAQRPFYSPRHLILRIRDPFRKPLRVLSSLTLLTLLDRRERHASGENGSTSPSLQPLKLSTPPTPLSQEKQTPHPESKSPATPPFTQLHPQEKRPASRDEIHGTKLRVLAVLNDRAFYRILCPVRRLQLRLLLIPPIPPIRRIHRDLSQNHRPTSIQKVPRADTHLPIHPLLDPA